MYKYILKPFLFLISPEKAHQVTLFLLTNIIRIPFVGFVLRKIYVIKHPKLKRKIWNLEFENPVGLAAGFDKNGAYVDAMSHLGFGFIEIGTVTPVAQSGNPSPRLFRLPADRALINRMGFNNDGIQPLINRLKSRKKSDIIIGGNIGKNKVTPNENATDDYITCFEYLYDYVDYFAVNVSSPNTPGLRALQEKEPLTRLLMALIQKNAEKKVEKPILLKIAPDLSIPQLDDIIDIVTTTGIHGIIATNTTIDRTHLMTDVTGLGDGGLSGAPLKNKSTEVIRYIHQKAKGKITIIGVGGIESPEDAVEKLNAGASLIQVYSGLVYEGPSLIRRINEKLIEG
jgi:dihydroorotate dehydrogenase